LIALHPTLPAGREVYVCIRAEDVILAKGEPMQSSPRNCLAATVKGLTMEGPIVRIDLDAGFPLAAILTKQACEELNLKPGDKLSALIKAPQIHLIER
jgi:molybdate transport system ATP-binding protein